MRQLLKLYGDAAFNPLSISGLQLWLSSRYASSMLQERSSATTLASANGDPIGTWRDLSTNANHVTAPTSDTKRPTLGTSSLNGLPGVVFDGTDDVLSNAVGLFSSVSSYSIFTVFKGNSPSGTAASVITSNLVIPNYMTNGNLMRSYGGSGSNYGESAFTYTDTNPYIFSLQYDGAGSLNADRLKRWKNGSAETLSFTGTIAATTASSTSTVVGAQGTTFNYFKGTIYEIIAYTPVLSESQRQQVQRGLATLWGITLS